MAGVQQSLEQMARLGVLTLGPEDEHMSQPAGIRNPAAVSRRARELVRELEDNLAQIRGSRHYSDAGLKVQAAAAATRALNELQRLRAPMQVAINDRDRRRQELATTAVADGDDVAAALLRQELRRELRQVGDALATKTKALQAVEKGDKATVAALLETGGSIFALLPEGELAEVRQAWAAKMAPAKAQELRA